MRVVNLIKQASANASETTTSDQTSGNAAQAKVQREEFELNVTEEPPTADQLRTILEYVGPARIPSIVKGANTEMEALKLFKESADNFQRPVVRLPPAGRSLSACADRVRSSTGIVEKPLEETRNPRS